MSKLRLVMMVVFMSTCLQAHAAKPSRLTYEKEFPKAVPMTKTLAALELPLSTRLAQLSAQGPEGYRNLVSLMRDEKQVMQTRWKAVTAIGRIGKEKARPEIEYALNHPVWYMRSAGLVAMRGIDRTEAIKWARKMTADKALMVRVAAVDLLADLGDQNSSELLWQRLNSSSNFRNGQSLFIRSRIAEAISRLAVPGQEKKLVSLLSDRDETLHWPAIRALERITDKSFGGDGMKLDERRARWQEWGRSAGQRPVQTL